VFWTCDENFNSVETSSESIARWDWVYNLSDDKTDVYLNWCLTQSGISDSDVK